MVNIFVRFFACSGRDDDACMYHERTFVTYDGGATSLSLSFVIFFVLGIGDDTCAGCVRCRAKE